MPTISNNINNLIVFKIKPISILHTLYLIWYICYLQLGWHPVAVVQYTFTHKQYTKQHN